jgi:hypothetical protein
MFLFEDESDRFVEYFAKILQIFLSKRSDLDPSGQKVRDLILDTQYWYTDRKTHTHSEGSRQV